MIYFDHSSTSFPKAPGVGETMRETLEKYGVNIGRGNYQEAFAVEADIYDTRQRIAALLGGDDPRQVIFTPNITYSVNVFLKGFLHPGDHVVVSGMEHNAVMRPLLQLSRITGVRYTAASANDKGEVPPEAIEKAIEPATKAVITLHASNVSGTILPAADIGALCKRRGIYYALDTAQSAGSLPIDMCAMNVDFLAFTGHKSLLGPQGTGGFIVSRELAGKMEPLISGGTGSFSDRFEQPDRLPDKFESGTVNIPGILGLRAALLYLEKAGVETLHQRAMALTKRFLDGVRELPGVRIAGLPDIHGRTAVVSLSFPDRDNSRIAYALEKRFGIMTRVGLHCAPAAHKSLGTFPEGTIRFSFAASNTEDEILTGVKALSGILK